MEKKYLIVGTIIFLIIIIVSGSYLIDKGDGKEGQIQIRDKGIVVNIWMSDDRFDILKEHRMKYLFVDVGNTGSTGILETSKEEIGHFLEKVENYENETDYDFVLLPYSEVNTYNYDFNDDFQENFIRDYLELVSMGFDGVYVDIEPIRDEENYLKFLERVREEFSFVGVYSGAVGNHLDNEWEWSPDFYERVCKGVDFIFVPGYDSWSDSEGEYLDYIERQVSELSDLRLNCDLMLGVPTYSKSPETLENAFKSYSKAEGNRFVGIAIFAEWTTSEKEWSVFERWVG